MPPSPSPSPSSSSAGSVQYRRKVWLLVAASTLAYLTLGCYAAVLPGYVLHHLGLSNAALGLAMGVTGVVAVGLRPFGGSWGDRYGRRPLAVAGAAILGAGSGVLIGPGVLGVIVLGRLLTGAGDALFITATMAWAADAAEPERRGRAMATIGSASPSARSGPSGRVTTGATTASGSAPPASRCSRRC
jgi:MFS family permease